MGIIITEILKFLDKEKIEYSFYGEESHEISTFAPLNSLKENAITWARKISNIDFNVLREYSNVLIVVDESHESILCNYIKVNNPHRVFFTILDHYFDKRKSSSIHQRAIVETVNIGNNISVGANSYISKDVIIGNNVVISTNVSIEGKVKIGDNTVIEAGVVIGVSGYGHYIKEDKVSVRVPHLGGVVIGNYVAIGANTTVARGCLGDTIIEDYVKIDNLCHIAHNVIIKTRSMITACTEISGSTIIEEDVWIGPASALNNGITIGRNSIFGIGTVATKSIPEGKVVVGVPARIIRNNE